MSDTKASAVAAASPGNSKRWLHLTCLAASTQNSSVQKHSPMCVVGTTLSPCTQDNAIKLSLGQTLGIFQAAHTCDSRFLGQEVFSALLQQEPYHSLQVVYEVNLITPPRHILQQHQQQHQQSHQQQKPAQHAIAN